jgi:phosphoribosylglycinamide formyltransferase 1
METERQKKVVIFASGAGSNAKAIIEYFKGHGNIEISLVVTNRKEAKVLDVAKDNKIDTLYIPKSEWEQKEKVLETLASYDLIALAGFLLKIPDYLIEAFRNRIINIHPALLPKFGGKGMYGMNVHRAVKEAGELESGITIHLVDEVYDNGEYLAQFSVDLNGTETAEDIASKVLKLEHEYFPVIIERFIES